MGMIKVEIWGSFPAEVHGTKHFGASEHGHAHAVTDLIKYLSEEVLPRSINFDHNLHTDGEAPADGFEKPVEAKS